MGRGSHVDPRPITYRCDLDVHFYTLTCRCATVYIADYYIDYT